jgi:hypothetical protein
VDYNRVIYVEQGSYPCIMSGGCDFQARSERDC